MVVGQAQHISAERTMWAEVQWKQFGVVEVGQNCCQLVWLHYCQKYLSLLKIFMLLISLYTFIKIMLKVACKYGNDIFCPRVTSTTLV